MLSLRLLLTKYHDSIESLPREVISCGERVSMRWIDRFGTRFVGADRILLALQGSSGCMLFATAQKPEGESSRQLPPPISKPNASVPLAEQPPAAVKGSFDSKVLLGIAMAAILLVPLAAVLGGLIVFVGFKVQPAIVVRDSNDQSVHERYGSIPTEKPGDWDEPSSRVAEGPSPEGQPSVEFPPSHPTYVDDWKCRIRLIHPLLGDLTAEKWLVDGTEIVVEIDPAGKVAQQRQREQDRLTASALTLSLEWNGEQKVLDEGRYKVSYQDIRRIAESTPFSAKPTTLIARIESQTAAGIRSASESIELLVPHFRVSLESKHLLHVLESKLFAGREPKGKSLYHVEDSTQWIESLRKLSPGREWYAYASGNRLHSSMGIFGSDPSREAGDLRRLLNLKYTTGLEESFSQFRKYATGPFQEMLDATEKRFGDEDSDPQQALAGLQLMNDLLHRQAEIADALLKGEKRVDFGSKDNPWQEASRIAHQLAWVVRGPSWKSLYEPPFAQEAEIIAFIDRWRSRPMVRQQWGRIMDRAKELAAVAEQPIQRVVDLTLRTGTDSLMVPVVLTYRPDGADVSNGNRASPEDPFG